MKETTLPLGWSTYWARLTRPFGSYVQCHVAATNEDHAKRILRARYGEFELHELKLDDERQNGKRKAWGLL